MAKAKKNARNSGAGNRSRENNVVSIDDQRNNAPRRKMKSKVEIIPRNVSQENYVLNLEDDSKKIVMAVGPAGTGKTMLGALLAVRELMAGNIERIIITRPAVGTDGEKHGFLPGGIFDKMQPWIMPILDVFGEYFTPQQIKCMIDEGVIEIVPIGFMRGRSFDNCIILADEFQNTTESQAKCVLTRVGENSRLIATGDLNQSDFANKNGLFDFMNLLENNSSKLIAVCKFGKADVERSAIVAEVLKIYDDEE